MRLTAWDRRPPTGTAPRPVAVLRRRGGPIAAVLSKLCTAAGSFALQALAARALGAGGLGSFAVVYSVLLVVAAVGNGLVGDSLTALERRRPAVRSALISWCVLTATAGSLLGAGFLVITAALTVRDAVVFAVVCAVFVVETALRRLLQAAMRFWAGVVVETAGSIGALVALAGLAGLGALELADFVAALGIGQLVAVAVAVACLPAEERRPSRRRRTGPREGSVFGAFGEVGAFGLWRAGQQAIRPGVLTAVRSAVYHLAGRAALGQLEAARIYMSPALLAVQGLGTYLFSSYAARRHVPLRRLIERADRAVLGLSIGCVLAGALGTALLPWLGDAVTGGGFDVSAAAVFGWAVYAAAAAAVTPYQSLAAARGRQALVTGLRCVDAVLGLAACVALVAIGLSATWVPYLLAAGSCLGGALIRQGALAPMVGAADAASAVAAADTAADRYPRYS